MTNETKKPALNAFVVTGTADNPYFLKIGAAWKNKKGGFNIVLDALPPKGKLVLLPPKEETEDVSTDEPGE